MRTILDELYTCIKEAEAKNLSYSQLLSDIEKIDTKAMIEVGNISDGYHTFDELYYHRMMLFSVLCQTYKESAWKSKQHEDGDMYPNYFIVGIETPEGSFSYHYHLRHWDNFPVKEVEFAPPWDGHTSKDITRLLSLVNGPSTVEYETVSPSYASLQEITQKDGLAIIENKTPKGLFYYREGKHVIGIDNRTGNAFTESFPHRALAIRWLREERALTKEEVFESSREFPKFYGECVEIAKAEGYDYISFNGMVFEIDEPIPSFDNRICDTSELLSKRRG